MPFVPLDHPSEKGIYLINRSGYCHHVLMSVRIEVPSSLLLHGHDRRLAVEGGSLRRELGQVASSAPALFWLLIRCLDHVFCSIREKRSQLHGAGSH